MGGVKQLKNELVIANRILANQDVVDAYGHVSMRNPRNPHSFLIARSLAPELVTESDIVELDLDGNPVSNETRPLYLERFIHAGIYQARSDVTAVVHAHAEEILPFGIADGTRLRPVIHSGSFIGAEIPTWDIADQFGSTNLLVSNIEQAQDLAKTLHDNNVVLMRGHGFAAAASSLIEVVRMSVYLPRNARALLNALLVGGKIKSLSQEEINERNKKAYSPYSTATWRAWQFWAYKCGCGHMLTRPENSGGSS